MKKGFNVEDAIRELEAIEASFRLPELNLEQAFKDQARAEIVAKEIFSYLESAENKLEVLSLPGNEETD